MEDAKSLDRALRLLFELARNPGGLSVTDLARRLGTQRPPLYRPLQTLAKYRMVRRDDAKLYRLGIGILELAHFVAGSIADEVQPVLQRAADAATLPAMLLVAEGDELVTVASVKPARVGIYLDTPPGFVHPHGPTAPRAAVHALDPASSDDSEAVRFAREHGYALTTGVAAAGRTAVSAAVRLGAGGRIGAVLIVTDEQDARKTADLPSIVLAAAREIGELYGRDAESDLDEE